MRQPAGRQLHDLLTELMRYAALLHPESPTRGRQIPITQMFALHELDAGEPLSQQELAERLGLEKSTVSRLVAEMEGAGLLRRQRDPDNRRYYRLRITGRGRGAHARMADAFHGRYEQLIAMMTPTETAALQVGLPALVRALRQLSRE